jgi:hypothetical protein
MWVSGSTHVGRSRRRRRRRGEGDIVSVDAAPNLAPSNSIKKRFPDFVSSDNISSDNNHNRTSLGSPPLHALLYIT